jgi:hypothetical protein
MYLISWLRQVIENGEMSTSVAAAILNSQIITGEKSPYQELFSLRFHADPGIKTFIVQNADVTKQLITGKIGMTMSKTDELQNDEGGVVRVNGKRAGAKSIGTKRKELGIALAMVPAIPTKVM